MMKRKTKKDSELIEIVSTMQEQLAVLDKKFDQFMTKTLTELAQAMAASKPSPVRHVPIQHQTARPVERPGSGRPMYSVVCYSCGDDCEIPFRPSGNRPVYCKSCFAKKKAEQSSKPAIPTTFKPLAPESKRPEPKVEKKVRTKKTTTKKKMTTKKVAPKKKAPTKKKTTVKKKTAVKKKATKKKSIAKKKSKK